MKYTYDDWLVEINCYFKKNTVNFYRIGRSFKKLVQSRLYLAYFPDLKTCAKIEFKMSVKQVYNYMSVYDRFYNNSAYSDYSFSQLLELVYVPDSDIQKLGITPDMTVREIRKLVRPPKPQLPTVSKEDKPIAELNVMLDLVFASIDSVTDEACRQDPAGSKQAQKNYAARVLHKYYGV